MADIIASDLIHREATALFQACEKIGAVTIQHHRGTIGGNILQDNRCHHYNQSAFHRSGRQACHKDGGKICYAREDADRCNSTCQSDGASALMALDARITLASKDHKRTIRLAEFYTDEGIQPHAIEPDELLLEIIIPVNGGRSAYQRLSYRSAIDYPIVCAAVLLIPSAEKADEIEERQNCGRRHGKITALHCSGILVSYGEKVRRYRCVQKSGRCGNGQRGDVCGSQCGAATLEYRNKMVSHVVFKALCEAAQLSGQ